MNLSFDELSVLTIGEVIDMLTEQANDHVEWDYKATQDDIKKFFG